MKLHAYKEDYHLECLKRTDKDLSASLLIAFVFIVLFTVLDPSNFKLNYWHWRVVGLVFTGGTFVMSLMPFKKKMNVNYLFSIAFAGVLVMINGIFVQTVFLNDSSTMEKMAVTIGTISVYGGFNFFALGAKKEFFYIILVSLLPVLILAFVYASLQDFGYVMTILMMGGAIAFSLKRANQHSQEKYIYHKHLEHNERELKQQQKELQKKQEELERMNEELRSFNHSISHDFKTPIRAANSFSQLLARDINSKDYHRINQYVDFISDSMTKMNALLEALNAVSDLSSVDVEFEEVDLVPILNDAFREVTFGCRKKCEFYISEDLPLVSGDRNLLREVFTNILSNSMKYSRYQSTVVINVGYYQEGDNTIIYIKDNGIGFKMDYKDQLFTMFKRLHNEDEYEGTGVGLAIVKRIMGYHQGKVWATSVQGNGATFYLSFPAIVSDHTGLGMMAVA